VHATGEYTIADLMEAFSVGRLGNLGGVLYALVLCRSKIGLAS
jgi:hypothetical protein